MRTGSALLAMDLPGRAECRRRRGAYAATAAASGHRLPHCFGPPRRGANRSTSPQAAGATVSLHHPPCAVGRTCVSQCRRAGGAEAQDAVARWNHAPGDDVVEIHPAGGCAGDAAMPRPHARLGRSGLERQATVACGATGAGSDRTEHRTHSRCMAHFIVGGTNARSPLAHRAGRALALRGDHHRRLVGSWRTRHRTWPRALAPWSFR
jgi:hypothetical protein